MELEGRKGLVDTGKSSRTCSVPTISLHLAVWNVFRGFFGPKMAVFGPRMQFLKLRSATGESRSRPPTLSFSLKLCVIVLHTHGRSTLDPKKGYKTKTGSTSSVTLTLTRIEYWDRAGGGRNIV